MRKKITARLIDSIEPTGKAQVIHDTEIPGLQCRVSPKGKKVFYLYYRNADGQERRPSLGQFGLINIDDARKKALQMLCAVAEGGDPSKDRNLDKKSVTFSEFCDRYLHEYASRHKKPSSFKGDQSLINNHLLPRFGHRKVISIRRADIIEMHQEMHATPGAANRAVALISKMMNLAEKWEIRPDNTNPTRHVDKYKERKIERFLTKDERERLWRVLEETEQYQLEHGSVVPAIKLLALTGCRLSEILTLTWDMVDFEDSVLRLSDSKTGRKTVHLPELAVSELRQLEKKKCYPYVIYGRHEGKRLVGISRPWYRIRERAELGNVRIHDLRHTFASIGASAGLPLALIGKLLGHTQAQTTARYAHLFDDTLKSGAQMVGELYVPNSDASS